MIGACDVKLDKILQGSSVKYATQCIKELSNSSIVNLLNLQYVEDGHRSSKGIILSPCHIYLSSTQDAFSAMQNIVNSSPTSGERI